MTTNLTTNQATTATVMTAKELLQQQRFRACLHTAILHRAKGRVKENIRAKGDKVSHYSAREIAELAEQYLEQPGHKESITQLVLPWVHELIFKTRPK
jgi:hypothetical protein